jgi:hypothetical protein
MEFGAPLVLTSRIEVLSAGLFFKVSDDPAGRLSARRGQQLSQGPLAHLRPSPSTRSERVLSKEGAMRTRSTHQWTFGH